MNSSNKVDSAYNSPSWWYDIRGYFILRLTYRSRLKPLLVFFSKNMRDKHLEGAIGSGTFLSLILKLLKKQHLPIPKSIDAFDYSEMMLKGAEVNFKDEPYIKIIKADVSHLPYEDQAFDSVNIANSIHCFSEIDLALVEILRVMKPGATFAGNVLLYPSGNKLSKWIATKINNWGMKKGILYKPYTSEDIKNRLTKAGFVLVEENIVGNMYNFVAKKP